MKKSAFVRAMTFAIFVAGASMSASSAPIPGNSSGDPEGAQTFDVADQQIEAAVAEAVGALELSNAAPPAPAIPVPASVLNNLLTPSLKGTIWEDTSTFRDRRIDCHSVHCKDATLTFEPKGATANIGVELPEIRLDGELKIEKRRNTKSRPATIWVRDIHVAATFNVCRPVTVVSVGTMTIGQVDAEVDAVVDNIFEKRIKDKVRDAALPKLREFIEEKGPAIVDGLLGNGPRPGCDAPGGTTTTTLPPPPCVQPGCDAPGGTTTTTLPADPCVQPGCDDGDPCTTDDCSLGGCMHATASGLTGVQCRVEHFQTSECAGDMPRGLAVSVATKIAGVSRSVARALAVPARRERLLRVALKKLGAVTRITARATKQGVIDGGCADALNQQTAALKQALQAELRKR